MGILVGLYAIAYEPDFIKIVGTVLIIAELLAQVALIFVQFRSPKMKSYSVLKRLAIQFFALLIICLDEATYGQITVDIGQVDFYLNR